MVYHARFGFTAEPAMTSILLIIAASTFYALATLLIWLRIASKSSYLENNQYSHIFPALLGLGLHALLLWRLLAQPDGLNFSVLNCFTLFAWVIALISIGIKPSSPLKYSGLLLFPVCILSMLLALILPNTAVMIRVGSGWLQWHILFSTLAYCVLSIAALLALLLALQDQHLRQHQNRPWLASLPPLETTEHWLFGFIRIGFGLLTVTLLTGFAFAEDWFNHKSLFASVAWLVFLVLLLGRHIAGWRGQIAIRWTFGGMVALMLAFFGTKWVLEYLLQRS